MSTNLQTGRGHVSPVKRVHHVLDWVMVNLSWVPSVGAIASICVGGVLLALAQRREGDYDPVIVSWGISLTAAGIVLNLVLEIWRQKAKKSHRDELAQLIATIDDKLRPTAKDIAMLISASANQREKILQRVIDHAIVAAKDILARDGANVRVTVLEYRPSNGKGASLVPVSHTGRAQEPRTLYRNDGGRGQRIFAWLSGARDPIFVADVSVNWPHPEQLPSGYRTFIAAPLTHRGRLLGMLAADAPVPGDLDEIDIPVMAFIASLLTVAYTAARRRD